MGQVVGYDDGVKNPTSNAATAADVLALGPTMWLKADAGVTAVANAVSRWADQSGNGYDLIQNNGPAKPTYVANVVNGLPVLRFGSTLTCLGAEVGKGILSNLITASASTFFIVSRTTTADGGDHYLFRFGSGWFEGRYTGNPLVFRHTIYSGSAKTSESSGVAADTFQILTARHVGGKIYSAINGVETAGVTCGDPGQINEYPYWGSKDSSNGMLNGDIAEIICFNKDVSIAVSGTVGSYLTARYGL